MFNTLIRIALFHRHVQVWRRSRRHSLQEFRWQDAWKGRRWENDIVGSNGDIPGKNIIRSLEKIGKAEVQHTATLNTRSGNLVPSSVGQTRELADGSANGKPRTRDLETGFFMKTTPTTLKNGDIKHARFAGEKFDLATVHQQAVSGSARLKKGRSMILAGFSKEAASGFFRKKNRVVVTVVTPRQL